MLSNDKEIALNLETTIRKSNEFSLAKLSNGMSLAQTQLFSFALLNTPNARQVRFRRIDFMACFNLKTYKTETALKDVKMLIDLKFSTVDLEADKFSFRNIFSEFSYERGIFEAVWTPEILPHILNLQEKYIMTDLSLTSKFRSSYSWILYDVIKAYYKYHFKEYSHKALMHLFSVEDKETYTKNFAALKRSVIDVAVDEINKYTEYTITYQEIKNGRKVGAVRFEWSKGKVISKITDAQALEIQQLVQFVMAQDPMVKYLKGVHPTRIEESITIVREFFEMDADIEEFTKNLDYSSADDMLNHLRNQIAKLENNILYDAPKKRVFYNWLEERE